MKKVDCLIIGAGLAGLSVAWHLAQRTQNILVIDQEAGAGVHSSGRNAAMAMQVTRDPITSALARQGAAFLRACARIWGEDIGFRRNGSILIGTQEQLDGYSETIKACRKDGIAVMRLDRRECCARVPILDDLEFDGGIECPIDGWLDLEKLNTGYVREIRKHGVDFWSKCAAQSIQRKDGAYVVETSRETVQCDIIVNAAGAWAERIGKMAGAVSVPLTPYRRHIVQTTLIDDVSPSWPIVWDLAHGFYIRPQEGGLLMSPCDQEPATAGIPNVDESVLSAFRQKIQKNLPQIGDYEVARSWAGLRTMPPDGRFVVGWDPTLSGFYWMAGLGGHGVVVSAALGDMAANQLMEPQMSHATPYDPARFQGAGIA